MHLLVFDNKGWLFLFWVSTIGLQVWKDSSITLPAASWGPSSVQWSPWKFLGVIVFYSAEFSQCRMGARWWWSCASEFSNYLLLITFHSAKVEWCSLSDLVQAGNLFIQDSSPRALEGHWVPTCSLRLTLLAALSVPLKKKRAVSNS